MEFRALIGLHNEDRRDNTKILLEFYGYKVTSCTTEDEIAERAREEHDVIIMDINLEHPCSENIEPARRVYSAVEERVRKGIVRFVAISGNDATVKLAEKSGIPADYSTNLVQFIVKLPKREQPAI